MLSRVEKANLSHFLTKETIKSGGQKVFYDIAHVFLHVIDEGIEREEVTQDSLLSFLRFKEYSGNVNRTIFTPIGAPHTWMHCLAILDWLASLARYVYHCDFELSQNHFA